MIRGSFFYPYKQLILADVTWWNDDDIVEDLQFRTDEGDIVMYFYDLETATEWCKSNKIEYKVLYDDDN